MKSEYHQTKKLVNDYRLFKMQQANELIPRVGYYALGEFNEIPRPNTKAQIVALAFWTNDTQFKQFIEVKVNISPLYNRASNGDKLVQFSKLADKIIHITDVSLVEGLYEGKVTKTYKVDWRILGSIDKFVDLSEGNIEADYYEMEAGLSDFESDQVLQAEEKYLDEELLLSVYDEEIHNQTDDDSFAKWFENEGILNYYWDLEHSDDPQNCLLLDELDEQETEAEAVEEQSPSEDF
ncbi:hypothetical protein [Pedobacter psychroterrae]|uniref:Uncharacterized protein n=1 Tax=Pedobacter psychroterrae TaxID=2530453 RepID=A0A4R0NH21_9SPHI|nr:hypothetical protein [Pedobacter psychroterrae]TCC98044.1 hypothetical protein EZ437_19560 [Pedobacter psychroterrae]